jgi:hypothetical protein
MQLRGSGRAATEQRQPASVDVVLAGQWLCGGRQRRLLLLWPAGAGAGGAGAAAAACAGSTQRRLLLWLAQGQAVVAAATPAD